MFKTDVNNLPKYSNTEVDLVCDNCSIEKRMTYKLYTSYGYCNGEYYCRKCKLKKNNLEKYGVENVFQLKEIKDKTKKTNLGKYGVEYISQSNDIKEKKIKNNLDKYGEVHHLKNKSILEKQKNTNLNKYGVDNISKLDTIKEKKKYKCLKEHGVDYYFQTIQFKESLLNTNMDKYGTEHSFQADIVKENIIRTNIERYGVDNPSKNIDIINKIKKSVTNTLHNKILLGNDNIINIDSDNRMFEIYCDDCKQNFNITYFLFYKRRETKTKICTNCNIIDKHQSGKEILLQELIKNNYDGELLFNYKLCNRELDVYIPKLKLAFEFNGVYWHSEIFRSKNYHKDKTDLCNKNNIQLIHIWEDDWIYKNDIIKSMILNKLNKNKKIYARNCEIREVIDINLIKDFLNKNHIQGYVNSSIKVGLFNNDELVSLMCFKKSKNEYELNRFCNLLNTTVIGSASKILKYFINKYNDNIFTFSDNSYSSGNLYELLNFKKLYDLKPDYHYVVSGIRIHKFNFRKKDTSSIYKIFDAGKKKYKYNR
jgi:hypothetical protein